MITVRRKWRRSAGAVLQSPGHPAAHVGGRISRRPVEEASVAAPVLSEPVPIRYTEGRPRVGSGGAGEETKKPCPNFRFAPRATKARWSSTSPRFVALGAKRKFGHGFLVTSPAPPEP